MNPPPARLALESEQSDPQSTGSADWGGLALAESGPLLDRAAIRAAAAAGVSGAAILTATPIAGEYRCVAVAGESPIPVRQSVEWGAAGEGAKLELGGRAPIVPLCEAPVEYGGRHIGRIVLFGGKPRGAGQRKAEAALEALATSVAPALAVEWMNTVQNHLVEMDAIVEVGQVLTGMLDMRDVLSHVVYLAESLVRGHSAGIGLLAEEGKHVLLHNCTGTLREAEGHEIPLNESLVGWVVANGTAVVSPSLAEDERSSAVERQQGAGVVVPITSSGEVIGAFVVARLPGAGGFGPGEVAILQKISAYAAIAITNATTHQRQEEAANALRAQALELEKAYNELTRSQEQLLVSEKMAALGRVTAGIAHEINSPLSGILNSIKSAQAYVAEYRTSVTDSEVTVEDHYAIAEDIGQALVVAEAAATKVAQYVRSIKGQTRRGEGQSTTFDPAAEIDATVVLISHDIRRRNIAVYSDLEQGHSLVGDQGKFGVVVQNLLSNAFDAYEGEPGEVWIRLHAQGNELKIAVEDRGCGIPEEIRGRIFDYLFTTKDVGKGTGLGLAMVHSVVTSSFGGRIEITSEPGIGTTFTLIFPLDRAGDEHGA
jgi:signal transduction histidine kinase